MSVQRRFSRQYDRWLLKCHATGSDKRWPATMIFAIERLKYLLAQKGG